MPASLSATDSTAVRARTAKSIASEAQVPSAAPAAARAAAALRVPDKKMVLEENRRERERMQRSALSAESESEFWSTYLKKYAILERSSDYQDYLGVLAQLCRPLPAGAVILDAGCGNGMFGLWVLREAARQKARPASGPPLVYVGLDLTQRGLSDAMSRHVEVRRPAGAGAVATAARHFAR